MLSETGERLGAGRQLARSTGAVAFPLALFAAVGAGVLAVAALGCGTAGTTCLIQYDAHEYLAIAERGYWYVPGEQSPVVWFPLTPVLVAAVDAVVGDVTTAGVVVSAIAGGLAFVALWHWFSKVGLRGRGRVLALLVVATYPYAFFLYGIPYSTSVFLAAASLGFLLVATGHPVLAAIPVALATACRPEGWILIPTLVLLDLERVGALAFDPSRAEWRRRWGVPSAIVRERVRAASFGPAIGAVGLVGYGSFLAARFSDPLAFATNQATYRPGDLPFTKLAFGDRMLDPVANPVLSGTLAVQALVALGVLWLVPAVSARVGFGAGIYVALLVAIPTITTADFMGIGRYLVAAFPAAVVVAERLAPRRGAAIVWLAVSASGLLVLAGLYARGNYLS